MALLALKGRRALFSIVTYHALWKKGVSLRGMRTRIDGVDVIYESANITRRSSIAL